MSVEKRHARLRPNVFYERTRDEKLAGTIPIDYTKYPHPVRDISRYVETNDGSADASEGFNAAILAAQRGGSRRLIVPSGTYLLDSPVGPTDELFGLEIEGSGMQTTILRASHSDGPVLRFNRSNGRLVGLTIDATTARQNGGASSIGSSWNDNVGLLIEPPDEPGKACSLMTLDSVRVLRQPSDGIVQVGSAQNSRYVQVLSQSNAGHGIRLDEGTLTGRTNLSAPGIITFDTCWVIANGGHGLLGGHTNNTGGVGCFRLLLLNLEATDNALQAGTRLSAHQVWIQGQNIVILDSAFGETSSSPTTGGLRFAGRGLHMINHRAVSTLDTLSLGLNSVDGFTHRIKVEGLRVVNVEQDPVIVLEEDGIRDIQVELESTANVKSVFTAGAVQAAVSRSPTTSIVRKATTETVNNSTTLQDDDELKLALAANEEVEFEAVIRFDGNASADIKFAFTAPTGATVRWAPANSVRIAPDDSVTVLDGEIDGGATLAFGTAGAGSVRTVTLVGTVLMGATSGNLQLQWAQDSAVAADTRVLEGSTLRVFRQNQRI